MDMKSISFLDQSAAHLPEVMARGDRLNLNHSKIIITDLLLNAPVTNKYKFAYLVEPECILSAPYDYIKTNWSKFSAVFTHDVDVLKVCPNSKFIPFGTTFLSDDEISLYSKTKMVSMIASGKTMCFGHRFRQTVLESVRDDVDLFGRQVNPIDRKVDGLKDYRYSIAIENSKRDYFFTEKLLDCFLAGTVPIYWGCPSIADFFDINGIIVVDSVSEIKDSLESLSEEDYDSRTSAIERNFTLAKQYLHPYDRVYDEVDSYKE